MILAIPVDQQEMETNVCTSFGRAPYFLIYNTDTKERKFLDNSAAASAGGAGIKAAQVVVDSGASVLLTPRCGKNAADVLQGAGLKMYKTVEGSAKDNIESFAANKLEALDEIHAGFHGRGGK